MLREIKEVSQKPGEPRKRWFSSQELDLFVWFNADDEIVSYQLSYNKPRAEKILLWKAGHGFDHLGVDDGARPGKHPGSPLLVSDGEISASRILSLLNNSADDLDAAIKNFIVAGIQDNFK